MNNQIYAVYKGKEFLFHGTRDEISEVTSLNKKTITCYGSPSYLKKTEDSETALRIIKISGAFK